MDKIVLKPTKEHASFVTLREASLVYVGDEVVGTFTPTEILDDYLSPEEAADLAERATEASKHMLTPEKTKATLDRFRNA